MRDMSLDWCYEGGCTYMNATDNTMIQDEPDTEELEAIYREPCIGMYD